MIGALASAVSAFQVGATRLSVAGDNIVAAPSRAPLPASADAWTGYRPKAVASVTGPVGGVRAAVVPVQPAYVPVADGAGGTEARPNVETATDLVTLGDARRGYAAAAGVVRTAEDMTRTLLDIKS